MLTESNLNEVLNRASKLMSPDGQKIIESHRKNNVQRFDNNGDYIMTPNKQISRHKTSPVNNVPNKPSGLPRAIVESILQNPLEAPATEFNASSSVLDSMPVQPKKETVTEQQYMPQYQPQPMSVDYNYIRSIINECIQTNLQQIKNEILQESQLKAIRIGGENKIQLIDNKNNLFESKLEFKKNISKNK